MTLQANLGYSPWDVFHQGLGKHFGLTIGVTGILVALVIAVISVFMKERIGIGTILSTLVVGIGIDVVMFWEWVPLMRTFISGILLMICGFFVASVGTFLYLGVGYGAGPKDALMVVLTKRSGKPVGLCRCCVEGAALFTGWLLGGYAGVGTVIYMFGIGIVMQIVFSIFHFDVKKVHHESCYETWLRLRSALK